LTKAKLSLFIRGKSILSSEDYGCKGSVAKRKSLVMSFETFGAKMDWQ
jgi:hypothetical protein